MTKSLLIACCLAMPALAYAHSVDANTIIYDDDELVSTENPNGSWDPNGDVPPQPEADYYVNMQNSSNVYYRLTEVAGTDPVMYQCEMPVLVGNFKIYAKEYWTNRTQSDYNQNDYIYGSREQPTGFDRETYKQLGNPGGDLQIEGGGTWYGTTISFWPTGHDGSGTPDLMITGGSKNQQVITIAGTGTTTDDTTGEISFTISTDGIVSADTQTYTVTATYTDASGNSVTKTTEVTGLTGTISGLDNLTADAVTAVTLTVEGKNLPYYTDPATPTVSAGTKDFTASTTVDIATGTAYNPQIYLIGDLADNPWMPTAGVAGTVDPENSNIVQWHNVSLTGEKRFRFTSQLAGWDVLNSQGTQYYPTASTQACTNYAVDNTAWYAANSGKQTDNAWAPSDNARSIGSNTTFDIYYNLATNEVAVGWNDLTGINDAAAEPAADTPVTVYSISGAVVRSAVPYSTATAGLAPGFYIAGGHKVFVK